MLVVEAPAGQRSGAWSPTAAWAPGTTHTSLHRRPGLGRGRRAVATTVFDNSGTR
ncbi:hypothetical protein QJS66_02665 [Kocuria rhizophila]|nr:hypothetical protein QJS66_02665 [Kocuria rhizophila]